MAAARDFCLFLALQWSAFRQCCRAALLRPIRHAKTSLRSETRQKLGVWPVCMPIGNADEGRCVWQVRLQQRSHAGRCRSRSVSWPLAAVATGGPALAFTLFCTAPGFLADTVRLTGRLQMAAVLVPKRGVPWAVVSATKLRLLPSGLYRLPVKVEAVFLPFQLNLKVFVPAITIAALEGSYGSRLVGSFA